MRSRAGPVGACGSSRASAASCTASDLQLVEQELRDLLSGYHRLVDEPPHNGPSGSGNPFGLGSPGNPDEPSGSGTPSGLGNPGGSAGLGKPGASGEPSSSPGTPGNPFGLGSPGNTGGLGSPDEPSGSGNPGNPFGLGTPGNTGGLGSPDEPSGSGIPGGLGTPSGSGIPGTPGGLGSPSGPSGLGSPGNPFGPGNPGSLASPSGPSGLGSPGNPFGPGTPGNPFGLGTPGNPFGLGNPGNTGGSGTPSGLGKPGGPFGLGTPSGSGIPGTPGGLGSPSGPSGLGSPGNPFGPGNPGSLGSPGGSGERRGHSVASLPVSSVRGDHSTDAATPRPFGHGCGAATKPAAIACAMPAAREASPVDLFADVLNEDQLSRFLGMQWKQPQQLLFRSRPCGVLSLNAQSGACEFPNIAYPPERQGAGSPIPHFAMSAPCHMYQELAQQAFSEQPQLKPHRADDEEDYEEYEDDCDSQRQYRHHPYDAYDGQTFTAHRCEHAPVRASDVRGGRRCRRVQKGDSTTPEIATSARRTENPSMRSGAVGCRPKVSGGPDKPSAPPNTNLPLHANARAGVTAPSRPAWIGRDAVRFHVMVERGLAAIAAGERGAAADLPAFADSLVGAAVSAVSPAVRRRQARLRESLHAREAETAQRGAHRGGGGGGGTVTTTASTTPTASITNVWSSRESYRLARSAAEGKEVSRRPKQMHHRAQRERHARQEAQPH